VEPREKHLIQEYLRFRERRSFIEAEACRIVKIVEQGELEHLEALEDELCSKYSWTPLVWQAFLQNTRKLRHVKRISGGPYSVHPTRMALTASEILTMQSPQGNVSPSFEKTLILALTHDYLEEGDGISPLSVQRIRDELPGQPWAWYGAVVLTEPQLNYNSMDRRNEFRIKDAAYITQMDFVLKNEPNSTLAQALANASLLDKLDNLHDLSYITSKHVGEKRDLKLARKFAFFSRVLEAMESYADSALVELLRSALLVRLEDLGVDAVHLDEALAQIDHCKSEYSQIIINGIRETHKELSLQETRASFA
jgi:hypothetical protein